MCQVLRCQLTLPVGKQTAGLAQAGAVQRIAQLVIVPVVQAQFNVVNEFPASQRGEGGYGSTGKA